jgi:APA family basic amino acid/polyamine antiporter
MAYLSLLPMHGDPNGATTVSQGIQFAANDRVGSAAATMIFGATGTILMAILIMVSTFSCNNGIILSSVRVYQAMARDGLFFDKMKDDNKNGVPGFALWIQFIWSALLCLSGQYGPLLDYVMFGVMLFYILTIAGIFVLRRTQPDAERPYRAFGYPIIPLTLYSFRYVVLRQSPLCQARKFHSRFGVNTIGYPCILYMESSEKEQPKDGMSFN